MPVLSGTSQRRSPHFSVSQKELVYCCDLQVDFEALCWLIQHGSLFNGENVTSDFVGGKKDRNVGLHSKNCEPLSCKFSMLTVTITLYSFVPF